MITEWDKKYKILVRLEAEVRLNKNVQFYYKKE